MVSVDTTRIFPLSFQLPGPEMCMFSVLHRLRPTLQTSWNQSLHLHGLSAGWQGSSEHAELLQNTVYHYRACHGFTFCSRTGKTAS